MTITIWRGGQLLRPSQTAMTTEPGPTDLPNPPGMAYYYDRRRNTYVQTNGQGVELRTSYYRHDMVGEELPESYARGREYVDGYGRVVSARDNSDGTTTVSLANGQTVTLNRAVPPREGWTVQAADEERLRWPWRFSGSGDVQPETRDAIRRQLEPRPGPRFGQHVISPETLVCSQCQRTLENLVAAQVLTCGELENRPTRIIRPGG